jgi:hypothetical protein
MSDTSSPSRNFTLTTEDRIRALTTGPPAYMRRKRYIEDLEQGFVARLLEQIELHPDLPDDAIVARAGKIDLTRINQLIVTHNRWYPSEANLPLDPRTGRLLERPDRPWQPLPPVTLASLIALARNSRP